MVKNLEQLRLEYDLFDVPFVPSRGKVVENLIEGLEIVDYYKGEFLNPCGGNDVYEGLSLNGSILEDCFDLQSRILDGYSWEIQRLLEVVDDDNFASVDKLGRFLRSKLRVNMLSVEEKKANAALQENFSAYGYGRVRNYPEENSIFVEVFFAEKFGEVTNKDLFVKEKK